MWYVFEVDFVKTSSGKCDPQATRTVWSRHMQCAALSIASHEIYSSGGMEHRLGMRGNV